MGADYPSEPLRLEQISSGTGSQVGLLPDQSR
jgi:hypothetical protein